MTTTTTSAPPALDTTVADQADTTVADQATAAERKTDRAVWRMNSATIVCTPPAAIITGFAVREFGYLPGAPVGIAVWLVALAVLGWPTAPWNGVRP